MDSKAVRFSVPPEGGENEGGGHAGRAVSGSPSLPTTDGSDAAPRAGGGGGSSSSDLPASSTSSPSTPGTSFWDEASADHPPTTRRSRTPLSGAGDSPRRDPWHPAPDEDPAKQRGDAALAKQVRELELRLAVQETEASALRAEAADLRLRIGEYKRQTYSDDTLQAVEEEVAKVISDGDRDLEALRAIKDEELRMLRRNHSADLEDLRRLLCAQESRASAASAAAAALLASPVSLEDPFGVLGMLLSLDVDLYQKKNFLPQPCDAAIKQAVTKLHDASQAPGEEVLSTRSMDAALASAAQLEASKRRIRAAFERQASEARSLRAAALSEAPAFRAVREGLAAELSGPGPAADFSARFQEYAVTKLHDASQAPGEEVLSTRSMDAALASAAQLEASKRRIRAAFERQASEARSLRAAALSEAPAFRAVREGLAAELSGPGPAADFSARFQEYVNLQAAFEDRLLAFARETEHAFDEHLSRDPQTHNLATIARAPQADGGLESIPEALRHRVRNDPLFRLLSASDSIFAESVAEMIRENLELKATRCVRKSPQSDREALERRAEAAALEDHCTRLHLQCAALEGQKAELRGFKQRTERELAALTDAAARLRRAAEEAGPPSPRPSVRFSPDVRPPGPQPPPPPPGGILLCFRAGVPLCCDGPARPVA
ncbi:hypothetical protein DIPPA_33611 [Diplonema papillatum]|nr:hypothetical protein DIPPA_33611 [Diplonema papillatum]